MKRFFVAMAVAILTVLGTAQTASAQEILLEGPLAGAPAVRKLVKYREMRFSVGPQVGYTLLNDYTHNILLGGRLEFNIFDWLSIGAVGYYGLNVPTKLTDYISTSENIGGTATTPGESNWPSYTGAAHFEDQVAKLTGMYLGQIAVIPLRGKVSLFESLFIGIDGYVFLGGGAVTFKERGDCDATLEESTCGTPENPVFKVESRVGPTFTWGVGFMTYYTDWFAVNIEYRMTPFMWNSGGTDEAGNAGAQWEYNDNAWEVTNRSGGDYPDGKINADDRSWNLNQSLAIGFIFYLPLDATISE